MVKVLVLGSTGMLGSQVMKTLKEKNEKVLEAKKLLAKGTKKST